MSRVVSRTASSAPAYLFAAFGLVVSGLYLALPDGGTRLVLLPVYPAAGALAVLWGIQRNRPAMRDAWLAVAAGLALFAIADVAFVTPLGWTVPSMADAVDLSAYAFLLLAAWRFARAAVPPESSDSLDAAIIATALGLILWQVLIEPSASASRDVTLSQAILGVAYPLLDIVGIAVVLPLVVRRGTRTPGTGLLLLAFIAMACADSLFGADAIRGVLVQSPATELGWLLAAGLLGLTALHPRWSDIGSVHVEPVARLDLARTIGLSCALLVSPLIMLWDSSDRGDGHVAMESIGGLLLALLVIVRLFRTVRQLMVAEGRFRQFMAHSGLLVSMKDERGGYRFLNPRGLQVNAAVGRAWLGRTDRELVGDDAAQAREVGDAAARAAGSAIVTTEERGGLIWHLERFPIQGLPGWVGEIGIDITDRVRAVERQRAAEAKLEARDRRIEQDAAQHARERALVADALRAIRPTDTLEATAAAACRSLVGVGEISVATVVTFGDHDLATVLAIEAADHVALTRGSLTPDRSEYLRSRAELGPWVERWVADPSHPYDAPLERLHISAHAYAPLVVEGQMTGLVIVGSSRADGQARLTEWLPALVEFAGIVGALLGPGLLAHSSRARLAAQIRSIIDDEAFRPVFQPIVDLESGASVGYEALSRFADDASPEDRFADAHLAGLGTELELATLERALEAARELPSDAWLDVNVSPAAVLEPRLRDIVHASTRRLVIEITEHEEIRDYAAFRAAFERLDGGAQLCVDDAGSGFASLRHVVELAPALVKIDRSLVAGIDHDSARQAAVAGMVHFAETAGLRLVAEGIERSGELLALRSLGIRLGQGFLLGRPAPAGIYVDTPAPVATRRRPARVPRGAATIECPTLRPDISTNPA